jgi:hypothetical protein
VRASIAPSFRPAMVSTGNDNTDIMMTWMQGNAFGIYYGPLRLPALTKVPIRSSFIRDTKHGIGKFLR